MGCPGLVGRYHTESAAGQSIDKQVVLDEDDELWGRLRHRHIADAIAALSDEAKALMNSNVANKLKPEAAGSSSAGGGDPKALKALSALVRSMPEHAARVTKVRDASDDDGSWGQSAVANKVAGPHPRPFCCTRTGTDFSTPKFMPGRHERVCRPQARNPRRGGAGAIRTRRPQSPRRVRWRRGH